ncbi:hypothetical protein BST85_03755 [Aureitalea marina]|uniref:Uncharacterized protein n=1 Tax=Aureitalea marina TaxID=930804 RepID=A0A2S7KNA5_9FLAO|nr:hypothetical protein BST85_03755 [Aureitalea marina]
MIVEQNHSKKILHMLTFNGITPFGRDPGPNVPEANKVLWTLFSEGPGGAVALIGWDYSLRS